MILLEDLQETAGSKRAQEERVAKKPRPLEFEDINNQMPI